MKEAGVLIVGGGLAAQRCAEALRRRGYDGPVRIACAESEPPYDRPPLSKEVLSGAAADDSVGYRPGWWYEEGEVELLLGSRAVSLDPRARMVGFESGAVVGYDKLLIATGGAPRRLPFLEGRSNVHYLRTLADARRLRAELVPGARLAIVGAGFIGQEVAATARALGVEVTMVEALETPLLPILGERLGRWFARLHSDEGVRVLTGRAIDSARGKQRVEELVLADGQSIQCDAVVVGVGTMPATDWVEGAVSSPAGSPPTRPAAPEYRTSSRPATPRCPSIPASAFMHAPSIGTRPPGRGRPPPRRCSVPIRARRRCRASGATSTGPGSSTSAMRTMRTMSSSKAIPTVATSRPCSPGAAGRSLL